MRFKSTIVLGIICIALAGYIYFVEIKGAKQKEVSEEESQQALSLERNKVTELTLNFSDRVIRCLRDTTESWRLVEPIETEGSKEDINRMLTSLADAKIRRTLADSVESLSEYGLDRPRVTISIRQEEEEAWKSLLLGDENPTGTSIYAKRGSQSPVFLVSSSLFGSLDKHLADLRFKKVLDVDKDDVNRISIHTSGRTIVCSKVLDQWSLEKPIRARADKDEVETVVRKISEAEAERFIDEYVDESDYGLHQPELTIELFVGEAKALKRLSIGKREGESYYARDASRNPIFIVDSSLVSALNKDVYHFRDKSVLAFKPYTVRRIHIWTPEMDLRCEKDSTGIWHIFEPFRCRADESKLNDMLWALEGLKAEEFVSDRPAELTPFGLSEPKMGLEFWMEGDSAVQALLVGEKKGDNVYVRNNMAPSVYLVKAEFLGKIATDTTEFRDTQILHFYASQVTEVEIVGGGETWTWKKDSKGDWKGPSGRKAEKSDVSGFLSGLQRLKVVEFVEDRPSDLAQYGLTAPQYTVTLQVEGKPSQVLFVGTERNEKVYVMNRDFGSVYSVQSDLMDTIRLLLPEEEGGA